MALYLSMDGNNTFNPAVDRLVGTTVTDEDGGYIFTELKPASTSWMWWTPPTRTGRSMG